MSLCIGVKTFIASTLPEGSYDDRGIPQISSSINLIGKFPKLTNFRHKNLCQYLDIIQGTRERIVIASEHYFKCLRDVDPDKIKKKIPSIMTDVLSGLEYLSMRNITHRNLSPNNIFIDSENNAKLGDYGLFYLSDCNCDVPFPI
ncbi:hypothetical protein MXB_3837, partial [Myxobolus squamalis]